MAIRNKQTLTYYLKSHWLVVGIFNCIFLASIYPSLGIKGGPLKPEYTVKYLAVFVIFFISGLSLQTNSIYLVLRQKKLHIFIQVFTFVFVPIFTQVIIAFLSKLGLNLWIVKGLITVACMPPPVSSAVILTKAARGNETAAIFNSVLGSFLGIIITPLLLLFNLGFTTIIPIIGTIVQLSLTVLFPLILGHSLKKFTAFAGHNLPFSTISQCALLFIIYTTFCDTFHTPDMGLNAPDILITMILVMLMQMCLLSISFIVAGYLKFFSPADIVCIVFCSTHKSLTLGIPILRIMFHGLPNLSQISLPLLVYHPTQMILGGMIVTYLKEWVNSKRIKKPPV